MFRSLPAQASAEIVQFSYIPQTQLLGSSADKHGRPSKTGSKGLYQHLHTLSLHSIFLTVAFHYLVIDFLQRAVSML